MSGRRTAKPKTLNTAKELTAAIATARKNLTAAKKQQNRDAIDAASRALAAASDGLAALHTGRFEAIASNKGNTAARALDELTKLCQQPRYKITQLHKAAIIDPLTAALEALANALESATHRREAIEGARRPIVFEKESAHVSGARVQG